MRYRQRRPEPATTTTTEPAIVNNPAPAPSPTVPFDINSYHLEITGLVNSQLSLLYAQILSYPTITQGVELVCPGIEDVTDVWTGVPVSTLLKEAGLTTETGDVVFTGNGGYFIEIPLSSALQDSVFLAYQVDGQPTLETGGYPLRLVLNYGPGYEWVKGVTKIEVKQAQVSFSNSPAVIQNLRVSVPASRKMLCACLLASVSKTSKSGDQLSL
jgi:DMSO/TMAO reductase YedYZ molybdopterin-dependent catalytic subunit